MNSGSRTHSYQQEPERKAEAFVISFPCSMKMTNKSEEVNELNQCYRLASAGRKEQSGAGEWFTAGSWVELTAWPGVV